MQHGLQIKRNEHLRTSSLYPSAFRMIDITIISGANLLNTLYRDVPTSRMDLLMITDL